jgi:hypothetical protein
MAFFFRIFVITLFSLGFGTSTFAQTTTATPTNPTIEKDVYDNYNVLMQARKYCDSVVTGKGLSSMYDAGGFANFNPGFGNGGGGGVVSVRDGGLIGAVQGTNNLLNEVRRLLAERNFSEDCFKALSMANSVQAIKKDLENFQKKAAENNITDPKKVAQQAKNKEVQKEIRRQQESKNTNKNAAIETIAKVLEGPKEKSYKMTASDIDKCTKAGSSRVSWECWDEIGEGNNYEDYSKQTILNLGLNSGAAAGEVYIKSIPTGLAAPRYCTETYSGADPEGVKWDDEDCKPDSVKEEPIVVTQEKVKQLVNAPYNQAFSPSSQLGLDGGLSNINQRVQNGTVFNKNIGSNFGSGTGNATGDIKEQEKNKNALINNISLAIEIEKALIALEASSTSPCFYVPVATRVAVIAEATANITEYTKAINEVNAKWDYVVKNPQLDHTNFFINMSMQLANKWNKDFIQKLVDKFKEKAQACIDAKTLYEQQLAELRRLEEEARIRASSSTSTATTTP